MSFTALLSNFGMAQPVQAAQPAAQNNNAAKVQAQLQSGGGSMFARDRLAKDKGRERKMLGVTKARSTNMLNLRAKKVGGKAKA